MKILVTGAASGLGSLIVRALQSDHEVMGIDKEECDLRSWQSVQMLARITQELDVLVNCAGVNKIAYLAEFKPEDWDDVLNTNARSIFYTCKAFLPHLIRSKGTVLNIVSNASHMPMTSSTAYNASKGAAHIMTLQLARELTRNHGITVFGISPNKLKGTGMSDDIDRQVEKVRGWSTEEAHKYQLAGLLAGEETDPALLAEFVAFLLASKDRHKFLTGCVIPYGA
jgi:NAD(P)-dependent dehydrogenase (short-subunit alcohol dehydrogenase family)